jgi:3-polyprenyl-4-hydroxybenzoate decarboxylase
VFHNFAFISIKKTYPQQARKVMSAIWGLGQLMFTKIIVLVDADVNVHDCDRVWFHVGSNVHPRRKKGTGSICRNGPEGASHKLNLSPVLACDVIFSEGPTDILDHAAPICGCATRWASTPPANSPKKATPAPGRPRCSRLAKSATS